MLDQRSRLHAAVVITIAVVLHATAIAQVLPANKNPKFNASINPDFNASINPNYAKLSGLYLFNLGEVDRSYRAKRKWRL